MSGFSTSLPRLLSVWAACWIGVAFATPASAAMWRSVSSEELALAAPRVDPGAGVEILFRETDIDDSAKDETIYHTYVRLRVFDARGVAALDKIEVVEAHGSLVINLIARLIRPDGTIVTVDRNTIHAREMVRRGSRRVRARAFSFPALEPGCVVEYQWDEISEDGIGGLQLYFQDRFPAQRVRYRIKPFNYDNRGYQVITTGFRYEIPKLIADAEGYYPFGLTNVPALAEEPWMPPDDMVQPWMILYFLRQGDDAATWWRDTGRALAIAADRRTRSSPVIEKLARTLIRGIDDDLERLRRFAHYVRREITLVDSNEAGPLAPVDQKPARRTATEVIAAREGSVEEINLVFLALARAAGLEARVACATDRGQRMFHEPLPVRFMLPGTVVAVRLGGEWRFFDPGRRFVPFGQLAWANEGVTALVCDRARSEFVTTPRTPAAVSHIERTARLQLDASGAATGTVVLEYHGHPAAAERLELADETPSRRAEIIGVREAARFGAVELSDVDVGPCDDPDAPLVVSYQIRVPHYATVTETRLVVPPAFFQRGLAPVFVATGREHVIYLPFEFTETDTVELELPPGFAFAPVGAPPAFALPPALTYRGQITWSDDRRRLIHQRRITQGGMLFPVSTYPLLKQAFDELHRDDAQVVIAQLIRAEE